MPPLRWLACLGRNGWDHPLAVPEDMGTEAVNVVFLDSGLAQKRTGAELVSATGESWAGIAALDKYVPPSGLAAANLVLVSFDDPPRALVGTTGLVFSALTIADEIQTRPQDITTCQLNNKQFVAYDSSVNRLHVWDPTNAPTLLTRAGLAPPAVATVANQGAGAYAATARWYRTQWRTKVGSAYLRVSELGTAVAFTPSGAGASARVTRPAAAGETETHWVVFGSADSINGPYYALAEIVLATTTYDDSAAPSSYNTNTVAPVEGSNTPFPSVKYLVSDGNRLLGLGVWESAAGVSATPLPGRVYYTPVLGSTDRGDDERIEETVDTEGWIDLTPGGAGAEDRGLGGPLNGEIFAFQSRGIYRLIPTGQATAPFTRHQLTPHAGALSHRCIVLGEDEQGAQCIYFLDPVDGPRRILLGGAMQWLGRDVFDLWQTLSQDATVVKSWGVYDQRHKRILWWVATSSANQPNLILMYDVTKGRANGQIVRYGWAKWTGNAAKWQTGVMFPLAGGNTETPYGGPGTWGPYISRFPDPTPPRGKDYGVPPVTDACHPSGVAGATYRQAVGTYLATGSAQTISCGFQPTAVLVQPIDANNIGVIGHIPAVDAAGVIVTTSMGAGNSYRQEDGTIVTNGVTALTSDGFTIGTGATVNFATDVIVGALRYQYVAIYDPTGMYFRVGSYVGDHLDDRSITVAACFKPTLLWIYGSAQVRVVRDSNMVGDYSVADLQVNTVDYIQAFETNGFQIGADNLVNENGRTFYYLAWRDDSANRLAAQVLKTGSYAGSGAGQSIAVGWGLPAPFLEVGGPTVQGSMFRGTRHASLNSTRRGDGVVFTTCITALPSSGFTVGVPLDAAGKTYYWHAFRPGSLLV